MADRKPAWIKIAGPVVKSKISALVEALEVEGLSPADGSTLAEYLTKCSAEKENPYFEDGDASWGKFEELEDTCKELGISFVTGCDAKYEFDAAIRCYDATAGKEYQCEANQSGEPMLRLDQIESALQNDDTLREGVRKIDELILTAKRARGDHLHVFCIVEG